MSADLFSQAPVVMLPISDIIVPEDRQRKEAKADEALVNSIQQSGLFNPIIVRNDNTLVAGERRLDAYRQLKRDTIPARIFESLTPLAAHLIELQENIARKQLSWQEEVRATADYHKLRMSDFPGWTAQGTASDLGLSQSWVSRVLAVSRYLDDPDIAGAATFNGAFNLIEARADRTMAAAQARGLIAGDAVSRSLPAAIPATASKEEKTRMLLEGMDDNIQTSAAKTSDVLAKLDSADLAAKALKEAVNIERETSNDDRIVQGSFLEWAPSYSGTRFDVIHCDFPYGKNYKGSNTRKTGKATSAPTYGDTADIYFALVDCFLANQERFCYDQAHCLFWFDMIHYQWTIDQFTAAGWKLVQPYPLVWTKGYQGVASDPKRRPRHCYETALLFSRGDRKIRKLDKDHFEEQVDEKLHLSQKPIRMLRHFLTLIVDEHTDVLDPTCGSGTALAAAEQLGVNRIFGIELEESNVDVARFILERESSSGKS